MGRHLTAEDRNYWVIDWLSRQGPAEWHGLAMAWDWEEGVEPLHWIIEQSACDRATALAIFWESDPEYFLSEDGIETPIGEMDEDIVTRWKAGQYSTSLFSYDPTEKADLPDESPVNDVITVDMGMPVSGSERAPSYSYGLPEEIEAAWNEANGVVEPAIWSPEDEDELDEVAALAGEAHAEAAQAEETWSAAPAPSFANLAFAPLDSNAPDFSVPDFAASASAAIGQSRPQVPPEMQPSAFQSIESNTEHTEISGEFVGTPNDFAPGIVEETPNQTAAITAPALFDEGENDAEPTPPPPSLAAYCWKSKPVIEAAEAPIEPAFELPETVEVTAEFEAELPVSTAETAIAPDDQFPSDMVDSSVDAAYKIPSLPRYDEEEEEDDLPPYQPLSNAAIDYDTVDTPPHDEPVFATDAREPVFASEEVFAEESETVEEEYDGDHDYGMQQPVYEVSEHPEPFTDNMSGGLMVHEEVAPLAAVETRPIVTTDDADNEEEGDDGDEASFAYDLKSMFAPPAPASGPGKFGTAVRVPPEPAPYVPTEQDLAARVAAVEAEAQVSSRIRSLRQSSIEEAQQAETSGGLMGKMRSMLGR